MRWLRLYDDTINDPKILKLPEAMRWHWIAMLCVASKNNGALPSLDDIAIQLRVSTGKAAEIIAILVKATLLDKTETGFVPHNWNGRQYKSDTADATAAQRMRRYRANHRNDRNAAVTVTTPREQTTETETEKKKETRASALDDWPPDYQAQFWNKFPNKVGKPKALAKLDRVRARGVSFQAVMDGLERYIRTKPVDRPWLNPETFLNQERWADQPAEISNGKTESLGFIAQRQVERGITFGDRPSGLRIVESGSDVRLLPEAGR